MNKFYTSLLINATNVFKEFVEIIRRIFRKIMECTYRMKNNCFTNLTEKYII